MRKKKVTKVKVGAWKKPLSFWTLTVLACLVVAGVIAMVRISTNKMIDSFQACKAAGGVIAESYPEQCFIDGRSFVNDIKFEESSDYVGLTEQEALDKAKKTGVPNRVVERDGELLSITTDYIIGRLNFYVENGQVYKVDIEGDD